MNTLHKTETAHGTETGTETGTVKPDEMLYLERKADTVVAKMGIDFKSFEKYRVLEGKVTRGGDRENDLDFKSHKNARFIAIGSRRNQRGGTWCIGDSITEIESRVGGNLKGFIVYGASRACPLYVNELLGFGTLGERYSDVTFYVAYDNRYASDKKNNPISDSDSGFQQDSGRTNFIELS